LHIADHRTGRTDALAHLARPTKVCWRHSAAGSSGTRIVPGSVAVRHHLDECDTDQPHAALSGHVRSGRSERLHLTIGLSRQHGGVTISALNQIGSGVADLPEN